MTKGLRTALWVLSSLAVLWTLLALIGWFSMGGMMGRETMGDSGMMGMMGGDSTRAAGRGMGGMMMGGKMMGGMMLHMALTWLVMLGLDGVFVYLLASWGRSRRVAEREA
ncbi:MAG: hypothetical protein H0T44_12235 [Gemmatimonadales bacterium]|nr:hypothetical protein [Gemmatimonadales bacterium]